MILSFSENSTVEIVYVGVLKVQIRPKLNLKTTRILISQPAIWLKLDFRLISRPRIDRSPQEYHRRQTRSFKSVLSFYWLLAADKRIYLVYELGPFAFYISRRFFLSKLRWLSCSTSCRTLYSKYYSCQTLERCTSTLIDKSTSCRFDVDKDRQARIA